VVFRYAGRKRRDKSPKLTAPAVRRMIAAMRLSRRRAVLVLLLALLHLGTGVLSALAPCCDDVVHASGETKMDCCLKGGPNHVCPFMSKAAKKRAAQTGRMAATCASGHDQGVPTMGFAGLVQDDAFVVIPELRVTALERSTETAISVIARAPSPPPKA
jgi:hypothetical protein